MFTKIVQGIIANVEREFLVVRNGEMWLKNKSPISFSLSHGSYNYLLTVPATSIRIGKAFENGYIFAKIDANFNVRYLKVKNISSGSIFPNIKEKNDIFFDTSKNFLYQWNSKKWEIVLGYFLAQFIDGRLNLANKGSYFRYYKRIKLSEVFFDNVGTPRTILTSYGYRFLTISERKNELKYTQLSNDIIAMPQINDIGKYLVVGYDKSKLVIMSHKNTNDLAIGLTISNLGEPLKIVTEGFITDVNWDWSEYKPSTSLFVSDNGDITPIPPSEGVLQKIGYVCTFNTIYIKPDIQILIEGD